jgi:hypothetical protein
MRYTPVSQRPRSTSWHRGVQNGRVASEERRPQIGQVGGCLAMVLLQHPDRRRQGWV